MGRLAAARDDDPLAGVSPQVRGHLANPRLVELHGRFVRRECLPQGGLGTARRRHDLLAVEDRPSQHHRVIEHVAGGQAEPVVGHPSRDGELALDHVEPVHRRSFPFAQPPARKPPMVTGAIFLETEEVAVQGENDLRLVELVTRDERRPEGQRRALRARWHAKPSRKHASQPRARPRGSVRGADRATAKPGSSLRIRSPFPLRSRIAA